MGTTVKVELRWASERLRGGEGLRERALTERPAPRRGSGGLQVAFNNVVEHEVTLAEQATVGDLIAALAALTGNQKQHFVRGDALRPGILVMVNDVDWELEGREAAPLSGGDHVVFLSTMHGG